MRRNAADESIHSPDTVKTGHRESKTTRKESVRDKKDRVWFEGVEFGRNRSGRKGSKEKDEIVEIEESAKRSS